MVEKLLETYEKIYDKKFEISPKAVGTPGTSIMAMFGMNMVHILQN